jgi:phenylacetate-CoA ligase
MQDSRHSSINIGQDDPASQPVQLSLRSNVLLYELPGFGSETPGHFLLTDLVTGQHFGLSHEQAAIIRTLQVLQETVSFKDVSIACRQKFGVTVDCSAIHSLLKDLDDLALIKRKDLSREQIVARQMQKRRGILERLQCDHLSSLLQWMKNSLEFYKHKLADHPARISELEEMLALPITTREDVLQSLHELLPAKFSQYSNVNWRSTSGTTSERMQTVHVGDYFEEVTQRVLHLNPFFDVETLGSPMCVLTTPVCSGLECHVDMNVPYERRLRYGRALFLNSVMNPVHFPEEKLEQIILEIQKHQPRYLYCNASYAAALAIYILRKQPGLPRLKTVLTSFEVTSKIHKRLLLQAFSCSSFEVYGLTEVSQAAMECEDGKMYVPHDKHIIEILDRDRRPVRPGEVGRLYVTSLRKYSVPLLRYQTTDLARAASEPSTARAEFCFQRIEGRISDLISKPDGQFLTPRMVDDVVSRCESGIGWYSLVQKSEDSYRFCLVPTPEYSTRSERRLSALLTELLGPEARILVEPVKEIRPGSSGKFRLCYQEKPQERLQNQF